MKKQKKHIISTPEAVELYKKGKMVIIVDDEDRENEGDLSIASEKITPDVKLGRIQNYKNWSPYMTVNPKRTSLGLEYFCTEGDELWKMNDVELIDLALEELEKIGIVSRKHLINGFVVRRKNVYPVYSLDYQSSLDVLQEYISGFKNLQTMGRAGLFRYDNSDHAMLSGIGAAKNYTNKSAYNLWSQGPQQEYLEM